MPPSTHTMPPRVLLNYTTTPNTRKLGIVTTPPNPRKAVRTMPPNPRRLLAGTTATPHRSIRTASNARSLVNPQMRLADMTQQDPVSEFFAECMPKELQIPREMHPIAKHIMKTVRKGPDKTFKSWEKRHGVMNGIATRTGKMSG